jgi:hypothetical protein
MECRSPLQILQEYETITDKIKLKLREIASNPAGDPKTMDPEVVNDLVASQVEQQNLLYELLGF